MTCTSEIYLVKPEEVRSDFKQSIRKHQCSFLPYSSYDIHTTGWGSYCEFTGLQVHSTLPSPPRTYTHTFVRICVSVGHHRVSCWRCSYTHTHTKGWHYMIYFLPSRRCEVVSVVSYHHGFSAPQTAKRITSSLVSTCTTNAPTPSSIGILSCTWTHGVNTTAEPAG